MERESLCRSRNFCATCHLRLNVFVASLQLLWSKISPTTNIKYPGDLSQRRPGLQLTERVSHFELLISKTNCLNNYVIFARAFATASGSQKRGHRRGPHLLRIRVCRKLSDKGLVALLDASSALQLFSRTVEGTISNRRPRRPGH